MVTVLGAIGLVTYIIATAPPPLLGRSRAQKIHLRHEYVNGLVDAPVGHYTYVTTRGEHLAHCAYILVRGVEARAAGERLDLLSGDLEHTRHCALFLFEYARQDPHFDTVNTPGDVMLSAC